MRARPWQQGVVMALVMAVGVVAFGWPFVIQPGAALDTYEIEPLPADHPLLGLDNVLLTPHLGFVTKDAYTRFYGDTVENVAAFLKGELMRVLNAG